MTETVLTPNIIDVKSITPHESSLVIEPLARGMGHTLGCALRRILLSSIPGAAVTEVIIAESVDSQMKSTEYCTPSKK